MKTDKIKDALKKLDRHYIVELHDYYPIIKQSLQLLSEVENRLFFTKKFLEEQFNNVGEGDFEYGFIQDLDKTLQKIKALRGGEYE